MDYPKFDTKTTAEDVINAFSYQIKGLNILVTGTTVRGLGCETALALARGLNGTGTIICTARSRAKFEETAAHIKEKVPNAKLRHLHLNYESKASIHKAAEEVNAYTEPLHILINNAGRVVMEQKFVDGHDLSWMGNFLGAFLFTNLILGKLMKADEDPSIKRRIINLSSCTHVVTDIMWDDPDQRTEHDGFKGYAQSKTAMILFSRYLADSSRVRFAASTAKPRLYVYSVHPGWIHTSIWYRDMDQETKYAFDVTDEKGVFKPVSDVPGFGRVEWKTFQQGAAPIITATFDPRLEDVNGEYITDTCNVGGDEVAAHAKSQESAVRLWQLCEKQLGQELNWK